MIKIAEPSARQEYDAILQQVIEGAESTSDRIQLMEYLMSDALQAHRFWASIVETSARRYGYAVEIKHYLKRTRVVVNINDRSVSKPRTIGTKRTDDAGNVVDLQLPFEVLTFDQIRDKRKEYLAQVSAYTDNVAIADRLLALEDLAPGSRTPQEASARLGLTLDEYLAGAA